MSEMIFRFLYSGMFLGVQSLSLWLMFRTKGTVTIQKWLRGMQTISCGFWVFLHCFIIRASTLEDWLTANLLGALTSMLLLVLFWVVGLQRVGRADG